MDNIDTFFRDLIGKFSKAARRVRLSNQDPVIGQIDRFDMKAAGEAFMHGFNAAFESRDNQLHHELDLVEIEHSGYAFEGAAVAIGSFGEDRWQNLEAFLTSVPHQRYNAISGCGGVFATSGLSAADIPETVDPFLRGLLVEGYAFHQAFFNYSTIILDQKRPRVCSNDVIAYNQGVGRTLWYAGAGNPDTINELINYHPEEMRADLWFGIAKQAGYCGGVERDFHRMRYHADKYRKDLATGCIFGLIARATSGYMPDHSEAAAQTMCSANSAQLAELLERIVSEERASGTANSYAVVHKRVKNEVRA